MFLIPIIRLIVFKYCTLFTSSIAFNGEIISPYSYYAKKGLVCVIIVNLFNHQPSSYSKYTKLNTCVLYNVRSVSFNKYIFFTYFASL